MFRTAAVSILLVLSLAALSRAGECRALIVSGDPGHDIGAADRLNDWRLRWEKLLVETYKFPQANVRTLHSPNKPAVPGDDSLGADAKVPQPKEIPPIPSAEMATRENVLTALESLVKESKEGDQVVLVWIGHQYDALNVSKFSLTGKDISDVEVARALAGLNAKTLVCFNTAPSSSPWAKSLKGSGRVIITATSVAEMRGDTYLCEFLLRAFQGENGNVLDAFNKAAADTIHWYQNQFLEKGGAVTVHGKVFQDAFHHLYADKQMIAGDPEPREVNNDPTNKEGWIGRRVLTEIPALEDNGDGKPTAIFSEERAVVPLPAKDGDGQFSKTVVLGKP